MRRTTNTPVSRSSLAARTQRMHTRRFSRLTSSLSLSPRSAGRTTSPSAQIRLRRSRSTLCVPRCLYTTTEHLRAATVFPSQPSPLQHNPVHSLHTSIATPLRHIAQDIHPSGKNTRTHGSPAGSSAQGPVSAHKLLSSHPAPAIRAPADRAYPAGAFCLRYLNLAGRAERPPRTLAPISR